MFQRRVWIESLDTKYHSKNSGLNTEVFQNYTKAAKSFVRSFDKELKLEVNKLLSFLKFGEFDVIGFSIMYRMQFDIAVLLAKAIKSKKDAKIIMGGSFFNNADSVALLQENRVIDYILIGEGEKSMLKLLKYLSNHKKVSLSKIGGLVYRELDKILRNKREVLNIDNTPLPDYDNIIKDYLKAGNPIDILVIPYQISRGCKGSCLFCNFKGDYAVNLKSPKLIVKDIKKLIKKYNIRNFYFSCNTVNMSNSHLRKLCLELIRSKVKIRWGAFARPEKLDLKLLKFMKEAGCYSLEYGIESGSQRMIDYLKKGFTVEDIERVIRDTKKAGIIVTGGLMFNIPTEKKEDIIETIRFIDRNKYWLDALKIHLFYLSYGSHLYLKKNYLIEQIKNDMRLVRNRSYLKKVFLIMQKNNIPFYLVYPGSILINKLVSDISSTKLISKLPMKWISQQITKG